jgi:hypothetical protein
VVISYQCFGTVYWPYSRVKKYNNKKKKKKKSQWPHLAKELRAPLGLLAIPVFDHFGGVNRHLVL